MHETGAVHFAVMRVDLYLPGVASLKGKRALLKRAIAALRNDLECSVAEVGYQDLWQRAGLGVAVAASTATGVDRVIERVVAVIERDPRVVVTGASSDRDVFEPTGIDLPHHLIEPVTETMADPPLDPPLDAGG